MAGGAGGLARASEMEGGEGSTVGEWVWSTKINQFAFYSQSTVSGRNQGDAPTSHFFLKSYVVLMEVIGQMRIAERNKGRQCLP